MRFSISLNSEHGSTVESVKLAVLAEKNGLECVWYCQDLFKRDVWVFLTAAASLTKTIKLGTGIVNPYTVNPAELAMHTLTLDEYSGGRVQLGISVGALEFLNWVGIQPHSPLQGMRESIELIRRLTRGERVEYDGDVFRGWTRDAYMRFKPLRSSIPIYLGAQKKRMLELIGEVADGGLPLLFPPEYIETVLKHVAAGASRVGRSLENVDVVGCLWFSISEDPDAAKEALRDLVTFYGPHLAPEMIATVGLKPEDFDPVKEALSRRDYTKARSLMTDEMAKLAIHGTPDDCVERIEGLIKMGLTHVRFGPPLGPNPEKAIELIGKEIIPYFSQED
jgi:5,10-methylenetetrahydromethanopterin reductase